MRLVLLGSPVVEHGGEASALPLERRSQLLAYLALKRAWVGRAELAAMLWPDQEAKLAYSNLRKTLFRLQSLPWASTLESQGNALRFTPRTDVLEFDAALREARVADAMRLWRGELLTGFDAPGETWSGWLQFERDRVRSAWRSALLEHLGTELDPAEAVDLATQLLESDPLDEAALAVHMSWLARSGQTARARQAYRDFADRLQRELGLDPGSELKSLHQSLTAGAGVALPATALRARTAPRDDGFIGRSIELKRIGELLAKSDCRLLTIVGPGGVGKTRLALRALELHAAAFEGDAMFVALENIGSAAAFGGHLARELDLKLTGGADPLAQVADVLAGRRMLLMLDNCEELASDPGAIGWLLNACPQLSIVATSRVRLGLPGEWLLALEGLPCPEIEDVDRIDAFDATRLFVRAAQRVEPGLVPANEAAAIVDICRQVEGLPLALELAAAWARVLSCEGIAAELREGTELLRAIDVSRPSRHASFDVVFEQSWRLLTGIERDTLARLSVFRGGFSAEAARAVAGASLPVLGALADKSLLRKEDARLSLHLLVRQLASLRLEGEARAASEQAHALHFNRWMAAQRRALESADRDALAAMDIDFENCRVAWRWAIAHQASELLQRSVLSLLHFCDLRDRYEEGLGLIVVGLHAGADWMDKGLAALLLASAAHLHYRLDRYAEAEAMANRGLAIARRLRQPGTLALCLQVLGSCSLRRGQHAAAREHFEQAHRHAVAANDPRKAGVMLHNQALVENALGRTDDALRLSFAALGYYRQAGDVAGEALCLNNLGLLYMTRKEPASATAQLQAGLAICDRHGFPGTRGLILANLTELAVKSRDLVTAARHAAAALEIAAATGNRALDAWLKFQLARLALANGDMARARERLAAAMEGALTIDRPSLQLDGLCCFAELLAQQGAGDCARAVLQFAAGHPLMNVPDREELRAQLAAERALDGDESAVDGATLPPDLDLRGLAHRIVIEAGSAYEPLIASMRRR